jgi:hypothetical protein
VEEKRNLVVIPWKRVPAKIFEVIELFKDARCAMNETRANLDSKFFDINRHFMKHFSSAAIKLLNYWNNTLKNRKRFDISKLYNCGCNGSSYSCDHYVRFKIPISNLRGEKEKMIKFSMRDCTVKLMPVEGVPELKDRKER